MSRLRRLVMVAFLIVGLPVVAWSQGLSGRNLSIINPLEYGASCTSATLNAAITSALSNTSNRILVLTPNDRPTLLNPTGTPCTWAITANVTVPRTLTLWVPDGATASISAAITLRADGPVLAHDPTWYSGAGTLLLTFPQSPVPSSFVYNGCAPAVPASSRVLAAFACTAFVTHSGGVWPVSQLAVGVTIPNVNSTHWLAIHRDTTTTISGWTRETGTHYFQRESATTPATVAGLLPFAKVTVAGGIITAIEAIAPLFPVELEVRRRRSPTVPINSTYVPDFLYGPYHQMLVTTGTITTVGAPIGALPGQELLIEVVNSTAVLLQVDWNAVFKSVQTLYLPAGRRMMARFILDGTGGWNPEGAPAARPLTHFGTNTGPGIGFIGAQTSTTFNTTVRGAVLGCVVLPVTPRANIGSTLLIGDSFISSTDVVTTRVFNIGTISAQPLNVAYDLAVACP